MFYRWKKAGLMLLLGASLAAASGCQAVGGIDIGKALEQQATAASAEGNGSWSFQVIPGKGKFSSDQDEAVAHMLGSTKLELKHIATKDVRHMSADGVLSYENNSIPFQLEIAGNRMVVQIDGGKKPIVFDNSLGGAGMPAARALLAEQLRQQFETKSADLIAVVAHFFYRNAPNPAHAEVTSVTETVYGQSQPLNLQKVHVELSGSELQELGKAFLQAIAADDKGLKEMIGQLYDIFAPMLKQALQAQVDEMKRQSSELGISDRSDMFSLQMAYLDNKTFAVEFLYTTLKQMLDKAVKELDNPGAAAAASPYGADAQRLLSDRLALKLDLLLDSALYIRKEHVELTVPVGDEQLEPVADIRITGDMQMWNHNKPVTVTSIPAGDDALQVGGLSGTDNVALLANFAPGSTMYRLLKDQLHITRQQTTLIFTGNDEYEYDATHPYISENGVAMVPARFIAERFGAGVKWDQGKQAVIIKDARSGTEISLQIGDSVAELNGKPVQLPSSAIMKNGSTYVPLRFIAEALGAKLEWDESGHTVTLTRE